MLPDKQPVLLNRLHTQDTLTDMNTVVTSAGRSDPINDADRETEIRARSLIMYTWQVWTF